MDRHDVLAGARHRGPRVDAGPLGRSNPLRQSPARASISGDDACGPSGPTLSSRPGRGTAPPLGRSAVGGEEVGLAAGEEAELLEAVDADESLAGRRRPRSCPRSCRRGVDSPSG